MDHKGDNVATMNAEMQRGMKIVQALGAAIMEAGDRGIPSGHLYAVVMGAVNIEEYTAAIGLLKKADLVSEKGHLLRWIGTRR